MELTYINYYGTPLFSSLDYACETFSEIDDHDPDIPAEKIEAVQQEVNSTLCETTPAEIRQLQLDDKPIGLLLEAVEKGAKPKPAEVKALGPVAQRLLELWERLVLEDGILKRKFDGCGRSTWLQLVPQKQNP